MLDDPKYARIVSSRVKLTSILHAQYTDLCRVQMMHMLSSEVLSNAKRKTRSLKLTRIQETKKVATQKS